MSTGRAYKKRERSVKGAPSRKDEPRLMRRPNDLEGTQKKFMCDLVRLPEAPKAVEM